MDTTMNTDTESIRHRARIAALPLAEGRATADRAQTLRDEMLYHRATQTYLRARPLFDTLGMQRGSENAFGAGDDVLPVWKKRLDARRADRAGAREELEARRHHETGVIVGRSGTPPRRRP